MKNTVFHEDAFYAYFQPFRHPSSHFNIWGGHGLETFGKDLQIARNFDPNCVWTVVEGDAGPDLWITPGLHYVNRICHLVTRAAHDDAPIIFRTEGRPRPITPIGLMRRMAVLRGVMHAHQEGLHLAY